LNPSIKKIGVYVEIGSYLGASASFIAAGIDDDTAILFCADTGTIDALPDGVRDTYHPFLLY
jgi:predicted O-methyltransferase YrrM